MDSPLSPPGSYAFVPFLPEATAVRQVFARDPAEPLIQLAFDVPWRGPAQARLWGLRAIGGGEELLGTYLGTLSLSAAAPGAGDAAPHLHDEPGSGCPLLRVHGTRLYMDQPGFFAIVVEVTDPCAHPRPLGEGWDFV